MVPDVGLALQALCYALTMYMSILVIGTGDLMH